MKANLMFRDRDFDINSNACFGKEALSIDLALKLMIDRMSLGDEVIASVCSVALFTPLTATEEIEYRQRMLEDALQHPDVIRKLYEAVTTAFVRKKKMWNWLFPSRHLSGTFSNSVEMLKIYTETLMELRRIADSNFSDVYSDACRNLFAMFQRELSDDYFMEIQAHLDELKDGSGTLVSATLGNWNQGVGYVLRRKNRKNFWFRWMFAPSFTLAPRDDAGGTDLSNRCDRAINEATNALAQSCEHLESFLTMLRNELAFYVGCVNLKEELAKLGLPTCTPRLCPIDSWSRSWKSLCDVSLALTKKSIVVGNDLVSENKTLYLITGANQGGKSTFLRSIGQAQLMAQCGMFVAAEQFAAPIRSEIFSHFKREEDSEMKSGKLDEELSRMDLIADQLKRYDMVLFNESFSSTNEREGSEICSQITRALLDNGIEVFSVTHLYTYAVAFLRTPRTQYLCAQRLEDGMRTFRVIPGEPLQTAYGEDLYREIFMQKR